jgi:hypothetical protein
MVGLPRCRATILCAVMFVPNIGSDQPAESVRGSQFGQILRSGPQNYLFCTVPWRARRTAASLHLAPSAHADSPTPGGLRTTVSEQLRIDDGGS